MNLEELHHGQSDEGAPLPVLRDATPITALQLPPRRLWFVILPLATGAGLIGYVVAGISLRLGIALVAATGLIAEAESVLTSSEMTEIVAAAQRGESVVVNVGGRIIQFEPGLPASGMTNFPDGFLIGREAFTQGEGSWPRPSSTSSTAWPPARSRPRGPREPQQRARPPRRRPSPNAPTSF